MASVAGAERNAGGSDGAHRGDHGFRPTKKPADRFAFVFLEDPPDKEGCAFIPVLVRRLAFLEE